MLRNSLLLLAISLAWAANYLFIREAGTALPPFSKTALTLAFAAALMLVTAVGILRRPLHRTLRAHWRLLLVLGLTAIALPNLSVVAAEDRISSGMASVVGTTVPIMTFLIVIVFLRHRAYTHARMAGVLVAVAGVAVYAGWNDLLHHASDLASIGIMMAGGCVFAVNGVLAESKTREIDGYSLTALVLLLGTLYLAALAFVFERHVVQFPTSRELLFIALAGTLGNAVAFLGYFILLRRATAYFTSFYAYLVPTLGVFLGVVFLDEPITTNHVVGLVMVLLGLRLLSSGTMPPAVPSHEKA